MPSTNVDLPFGLLWSSSNGQALPFGRVSQFSSSDSLSLEHVPAESEHVESPGPPQPLYEVFPEPKRERRVRFWKKKRKTFVVRGGGGAEPVATMVWHKFRPPRVEMNERPYGNPSKRATIAFKRDWTLREPLRQTRSVLVHNTDGREYTWLLDENSRGLSDAFVLELVPSMNGIPIVRGQQHDHLAILTFEDDDPPHDPPSFARRPRLNRAFLTIRVAEEDEAKIRTTCDLCVVSVLFLLAQMKERLEPRLGGAPIINSPPAGPRLLSPLRDLYDMITLPLRPSLETPHHVTVTPATPPAH
ncbi:unnamed protein product [Peniophora sp. CBMAI 1063]|nr:unnamed protein product [Peniophora sp. CBMAI 1063]